HVTLRAGGDGIGCSTWFGAVRRGPHGGAELVAVAFHRLAEAPVVTQAHPYQIDHRILHRHFHVLPLTRGLALHERGEDADGAVHPGARIANARPGDRRRIFGKSGHAHGPTHRLGHWLEALVPAVRTIS